MNFLLCAILLLTAVSAQVPELKDLVKENNYHDFEECYQDMVETTMALCDLVPSPDNEVWLTRFCKEGFLPNDRFFRKVICAMFANPDKDIRFDPQTFNVNMRPKKN